MRFRASLIAMVVAVEAYFIITAQLALNAGVGFLWVAPLAELWAYPGLVRKGVPSPDSALRAERSLVFAYECLIIGTANALAGPHVLPTVATVGAAILIGGQSLILWLVFKNPRIVRPVERPPSHKNLSARMIVVEFFYLALGIVGCAVFVSRSSHVVRPLPIEFQWPGIALLYAVFGCLALGLAAEHSKGSAALYLAVALVAASSVGMEFVGGQNWYFLAVSLFAFFCLVPGWPRAAARGPSEPSLNGVAEQSGR